MDIGPLAASLCGSQVKGRVAEHQVKGFAGVIVYEIALFEMGLGVEVAANRIGAIVDLIAVDVFFVRQEIEKIAHAAGQITNRKMLRHLQGGTYLGAKGMGGKELALFNFLFRFGICVIAGKLLPLKMMEFFLPV